MIFCIECGYVITKAQQEIAVQEAGGVWYHYGCWRQMLQRFERKYKPKEDE